MTILRTWKQHWWLSHRWALRWKKAAKQLRADLARVVKERDELAASQKRVIYAAEGVEVPPNMPCIRLPIIWPGETKKEATT
jgi:hypothetical protein